MLSLSVLFTCSKWTLCFRAVLALLLMLVTIGTTCDILWPDTTPGSKCSGVCGVEGIRAAGTDPEMIPFPSSENLDLTSAISAFPTLNILLTFWPYGAARPEIYLLNQGRINLQYVPACSNRPDMASCFGGILSSNQLEPSRSHRPASRWVSRLLGRHPRPQHALGHPGSQSDDLPAGALGEQG